MHDVDVEAIDNISTYLDSLNLTLASVTLNIKTNFLFHWKIQTTTFSSHRSAEIKYIFDLISVPVGLQLFGSFQKIMKRPPQSFVLATNWLLDGFQTPSKNGRCQFANLLLICQFEVFGLANWWYPFLGGSEVHKRVSWPIQNLVGVSLLFFEMIQKVAPLMFQPCKLTLFCWIAGIGIGAVRAMGTKAPLTRKGTCLPGTIK